MYLKRVPIDSASILPSGGAILLRKPFPGIFIGYGRNGEKQLISAFSTQAQARVFNITLSIRSRRQERLGLAGFDPQDEEPHCSPHRASRMPEARSILFSMAKEMIFSSAKRRTFFFALVMAV